MDSSDLGFFRQIGPAIEVALAACVIACAGSSAFADAGATTIAIDCMMPGAPPAGFTFAMTGGGAKAEWNVVGDPTASHGRAIEQSSADRTDRRFPLAIPDSFSAADLDAELRFKAVGGRTDQTGGIAVRLEDADNYYVARADARENNVRFYRVVNGRREQLGGADLNVTAGEWHTLAVHAEGERFTVSYDDKPLFSVADKTFDEAGGVALWTKGDSVTRFDQVKVTTLPRD